MRRINIGTSIRRGVAPIVLVCLTAGIVSSSSFELLSTTKVIVSGHGGEVRSVVFSPDGKLIASGSQDHTVKLWDPQTGQQLRTFTGHDGEKGSIALSPDSKTLAISTNENAAALYDVGSGALIRFFAGSKIAGPSAFSANGKLLVTKSLSEKNVQIWDVKTGNLSQVLTGHGGDVLGIAFSPNGKDIASIGSDKTLKLWEAQTGKVLMNLSEFKYSLVDVAFSPDGSTIASADETTIIFWDVQTGKRKTEVHSNFPSTDSFPPPVRSITFSPNGELLAVASYDNRFTLLDVSTGKPRYNFHPDSRPWSAAFSPDGNTVVIGCEPKALYVWSLETEELKLKIGTEAESYSVAFSPDGKTVASDGGVFYSAITFWDAQTGRLMRTLKGNQGGFTALEFSPDGKMLGGAESGMNAVRVWNLDSGDVVHTVELAEASEAGSVVFSPDGKLLAITGNYGDGTIRLLSPQTWQLKRTLIASKTIQETDPVTKKTEAFKLGVVCARFSPDGKALAALADSGRTVKWWNAQTWTLLRSVPLKVYDVLQCSFSPDLKLLVTNYQGLDNPRFANTDIWDTARGILLQSLPRQQAISPQAFSSDGKVFATAGTDTTAHLWDAQTGKLKLTFRGHMNKVSSAALSPDGQTLLTGSSDGTVRLWDLHTGEVKQVFVIDDSRTSSP